MAAAWKKEALKQANKDWYELHDLGYRLEMLTDYHWKYRGVDIWPSSKKYMRDKKVKTYTDLVDLVKSLGK